MALAVVHGSARLAQPRLQLIDPGTDRFAQGGQPHLCLLGLPAAFGELLGALACVGLGFVCSLLLAGEFGRRQAQFVRHLEEPVQGLAEVQQRGADGFQRRGIGGQVQVGRVGCQRIAAALQGIDGCAQLPIGCVEPALRSLELALAGRGVGVGGAQVFVRRCVLPFGCRPFLLPRELGQRVVDPA